MTDTELILNRLESLGTELKEEIQEVRTNMEDQYAELGGRIEAVRQAVFGIKERMDMLEFVLQTEIRNTYELALTSASQIKVLMAYRDKLSNMPAV